MKIHSFSKLLALPLVVATAYFLYLIFEPGSPHTVYIFIPVLLLTALFVFHGQIDYWWLKRNTPALDQKMKEWLTTYSPYYRQLDADQMKIFEDRLVLYVEGRSFQSVGTKELKDVPYDIKIIIASQAVRLLLGQKDFLLGDMDRIFLYKHPFPSPRYPFLHTVETDPEDGVLIFSTEQGLPGIVSPALYYNIVLHGYASSFFDLNPSIRLPEVSAIDWLDLERMEYVNGKNILRTCGYPQLDMRAVNTVLFFEFPEEYRRYFPAAYAELVSVFKQSRDIPD